MRLLQNLSKSLKGQAERQAAYLVKPLRNKAIFPVIDEITNNPGSSLRAPDQGNWYIADRQHLRDIFSGMVPLLDCPVDQLDALSALTKALKLQAKMLSRQAKSQLKPTGFPQLQRQLTTFIRERAPVIEL